MMLITPYINMKTERGHGYVPITERGKVCSEEGIVINTNRDFPLTKVLQYVGSGIHL